MMLTTKNCNLKPWIGQFDDFIKFWVQNQPPIQFNHRTHSGSLKNRSHLKSEHAYFIQRTTTTAQGSVVSNSMLRFVYSVFSVYVHCRFDTFNAWHRCSHCTDTSIHVYSYRIIHRMNAAHSNVYLFSRIFDIGLE